MFLGGAVFSYERGTPVLSHPWCTRPKCMQHSVSRHLKHMYMWGVRERKRARERGSTATARESPRRAVCATTRHAVSHTLQVQKYPDSMQETYSTCIKGKTCNSSLIKGIIFDIRRKHIETDLTFLLIMIFYPKSTG